MFTKISPLKLSIYKNEDIFEPHMGMTPDQIYGYDWKDAYMLVDYYTYYDDEGYNENRYNYLIHPAWKDISDVIAPFRYMVALHVNDGYLLPDDVPFEFPVPFGINYQPFDHKTYSLDDYYNIDMATSMCSPGAMRSAGIKLVRGDLFVGDCADIESKLLGTNWDESSFTLADCSNEHWEY